MTDKVKKFDYLNRKALCSVQNPEAMTMIAVSTYDMVELATGKVTPTVELVEVSRYGTKNVRLRVDEARSIAKTLSTALKD